MTDSEALRIAQATPGTYRGEGEPDGGDCTFGPCADCFRENCPERVEELRTYPRVTQSERSALLAILDDELEG